MRDLTRLYLMETLEKESKY